MTHYDKRLLEKAGENVIISATAEIKRPDLVSIGNHVAIDEYFVATTKMELGNHIHISKHVAVIGTARGLLRMGNFTNISVRGTIVCGSDGFNGEGLITAPGIPPEFCDKVTVEPVVFEDFANIGACVTILPGVTLPQGCVIGACSLVRKANALKPWTIYAGNPLREIRARPRERMLQFAKELGY